MNEMHTACPNSPCVFIGAENAAVLDGVPDESIDLMITTLPTATAEQRMAAESSAGSPCSGWNSKTPEPKVCLLWIGA